MLGVAWFSFSMGCLSFSEPSFRPAEWARGGFVAALERVMADPSPEVSTPSTLPSLPKSLEPSVEPSAAPPPKRRVVVSLPAVERSKPATHGGGQQAQVPAWEIPRRSEDILPPLPQAPPELEPEQPMGIASPRPRAAPTGVSASLPQRTQRELAALSPPPPALAPPAPQTADDSRVTPDETAEVTQVSPRVPSKERTWTATVGAGCERAYSEFEQTIDMAAGPGGPDVDPAAYAALLEDFDRYGACDLNHEMDISICAAVVHGRAAGVTVKTQPANARLAACISAAIQRTRFPKSPRMDLVRTELIVR